MDFLNGVEPWVIGIAFVLFVASILLMVKGLREEHKAQQKREQWSRGIREVVEHDPREPFPDDGGNHDRAAF